MTQQGLEMVRISPREGTKEQGSAARTVSDVMRLDVGAVSPETSVYRAARALAEHETPALPVVDRADHVVGVLSEEDLVARLGPRRHHPWWHFLTASDQLAREFRRSVGVTVADVMMHPVITASPTLALTTAAPVPIGYNARSDSSRHTTAHRSCARAPSIAHSFRPARIANPHTRQTLFPLAAAATGTVLVAASSVPSLSRCRTIRRTSDSGSSGDIGSEGTTEPSARS